MSNDKINWKHLQKYLTCQEYFVWHDFKKKDEFWTEDVDNFWSLSFEEDDQEEINYVEVHKTGFNIVQKSFEEWIIQKCHAEKIRLLIIKEKDLALRIKRTQAAMDDINVDAILYPVFEYQDAISKPTLFNKKKKKITNLNFNTATKRVDYIRAFFDFEIVKKNNYQVADFSIFTIEIKDFIEDDKITFEETFYANTTATKPQPKTKTIPSLKLAALGNPEKEIKTIFQKLESRSIIDSKKDNIKKPIIFFGIDIYLNNIRLAKNAFRTKIGEDDKTLWGTNKYFNEIAQEDFPEMLPLSGTLFNKNKILELHGDINNLNQFYNEHLTTKYINNQVDKIDYDALEKIINLLDHKKVVWYDFEGFSLPFPIIAYTLPYQQLIFQVSVIKTDQDQINDIKNIIIDPKYIQYHDFFQIIDAIYQESAEAYVVYNKTYENSKLKEMSKIFYKQGLLQHNMKLLAKIQEYDQKIEIIISRTVDLLDLFKVSSLSGPLPPIFLWELYGFSSIKKIEKYITKSKIKLEVMIEPYSELIVQNGLMAMSKAIDRNLGGIGDEEWFKTSDELKKYCENDVRAMLMVYHFAKKILKEKIIF